MEILINILNYAATVASGFCILGIICSIGEEISTNRFNEKKNIINIIDNINDFFPSAKFFKYLLVVCLISILFLSSTGCAIFNLDSIETKPDGVYSYIVQINDSLYPAQVRLSSEIKYKDDNNEYTKQYLYLEKVYISDDEYIEFSDTVIPKNKEVYVSSTDDDDYRVLFINKHINHKQITETKTLTAFNIFIDLIRFFSVLITLIAICYYDIKYKYKINKNNQ